MLIKFPYLDLCVTMDRLGFITQVQILDLEKSLNPIRSKRQTKNRHKIGIIKHSQFYAKNLCVKL